MKKSPVGWYHDSERGSFGTIKHLNLLCTEEERERFNWGPFPTFAKAKADAIAYFKADIDLANKCLEEINKLEKPRK